MKLAVLVAALHLLPGDRGAGAGASGIRSVAAMKRFAAHYRIARSYCNPWRAFRVAMALRFV